MLQRIRDIEDGLGNCIRLTLAPHPAGAIVALERLDQADQPSVTLSQYGADLLTGFIMAARLAVPEPMPDEYAPGPMAATFRLMFGRTPLIVIEQDDSGDGVEIGAPLWDRLYAELCMVCAHAREASKRSTSKTH